MPYSPDVNAERYPTLIDVAKRMDPNGSIAAIAELLDQTNSILTDAVFMEGNLPTGHRTTVRSDLPKGTWRLLNYGTKPTKSKTTQITDTIGMLETYSEIDKDLAMLNGNSASFRLSEDTAHIEGLNQQMAETLFYGDTSVNPERFLGLAARYDKLGTPANKPAAQNYLNQIINHANAKNTGDNDFISGSTTVRRTTPANAVTSIWLVIWGPQTIHMIYPKGSTAGLMHRDLGEQTLFDDDGGRFQGYRTHYQWKNGMVIRDWRYVVRIANVNPLEDINYKALIHAINTIPNPGMGRGAFYCTRSVKVNLEIAAAEKTNAGFSSVNDVFGKPMTMFWGVPLRQTDAILETEAVLS